MNEESKVNIPDEQPTREQPTVQENAGFTSGR